MGIVPLTFETLFTEIEAERAKQIKGRELKVTFSMLEIYSEQVRDLLNPESFKVSKGLKVKEHRSKCFNVPDLTTIQVTSYEDIKSNMQKGNMNRTIASTAMNETSSRAHTVVAITFSQNGLNETGKSITQTSIINLVDLAGSERAKSSGASGNRLKEGISINQSLSTLGNCIKALASKKSQVVPYRDSILTKLLKNAIGGNSKTIMIAALSPAGINYQETLSTLRFAKRAKIIKTKAKVNVSLTDKLIIDLQEENKHLLEILKSAEGLEINAMKKEMEQNKEEMDMIKRSWEQQKEELENKFQAEKRGKSELREKKSTIPHIWNLNDDENLSGLIIHFVEQAVTKIGNTKADPQPDIILGGLGIQEEHAVFHKDTNMVTITPCQAADVLLNGNTITSKKELHHNDRLMFGSNTLYIFDSPQYAEANTNKPPPTYEAAQMEIAENAGLQRNSSDKMSQEDLLLQDDFVELFPMIKEANSMSKELDKKCIFEIVIVNGNWLNKKHGRSEACVKVKNMESNVGVIWDKNKFMDQKFLMSEMYRKHILDDTEETPQEDDPFWLDPSAAELIGIAHILLGHMAYAIESTETADIFDFKSDKQGSVNVTVCPCDKHGRVMDDNVDEQLLGKELTFKVLINNARGLPPSVAASFCKYTMYLDDDAVSTNEVEGTINPDFNSEKIFSFHPATQKFLNYLKDDTLVIEVWGRQKANRDSNLNTQELFLREKNSVALSKQSVTPQPAHALYAVESVILKWRMERAEKKLRGIKRLMDENQDDAITVNAIKAIVKGGSGINTTVAKDGKVTSNSCILQ